MRLGRSMMRRIEGRMEKRRKRRGRIDAHKTLPGVVFFFLDVLVWGLTKPCQALVLLVLLVWGRERRKAEEVEETDGEGQMLTTPCQA